jgi:hypothetical protein
MGQAKEHDLFVIFAFPEQHVGSRTGYYTQDAKVTYIRTKAAKFYSFDEAKNFAERQNIELTGASYIGRATFSESELSRE